MQRMYRGRLKSGRGVFVKQVPAGVWRQQWRQQQRFQGQFLCDGENYVGEAAAAAFLTQYHPHCTAPLLAVLTDGAALEEAEVSAGHPASGGSPDSSGGSSDSQKRQKGRQHPQQGQQQQPLRGSNFGSERMRRRCTERVVLVFQVFGQSDLLDFVEANKPMAPWFKRKLQLSLVLLLHALHCAGVAHLDLTPENILVHSMFVGHVENCGSKPKGQAEGFPLQLRLCDFAKATPLFNYSNLRLPASLLASRYSSKYHQQLLLNSKETPATSQNFPPFLSCEPTIAKGPYMPPEAWKSLRLLRSLGVTSPFAQISEALLLTGRPPPPLRLPEGPSSAGGTRKGVDVSLLFFDVRKADIYMLGVLLFYSWADGAVWAISDPQQDEQFCRLVESDYCFSAFPECADWPAALLDLIRGCIEENPDKRLPLDGVLRHPWWSVPLANPHGKAHPLCEASVAALRPTVLPEDPSWP
ncbi:hypothetical protein Efla_000772 [Eimeria flavescens]